MSVNYIDKSTGDLIRVAGQGKAEYGASTVRTGTFTGTDNGTGLINITVTFDNPMPDADYLVEITDVSSVENFWVSVAAKTKNGFSLYLRKSTGGSSITVNGTYTAFKLYTDTEYNNLLELPDRVAALETTTSGDISGATTNSGTITSVSYARSGNVVQLRLTLTGASATTHGNTTLTVTMPSTVPVPVMTVDGVANIWNSSVDEVGHVRMSSGSRDIVIYSSNDSGADADITGAEVWATITYITQ